jgi:hypothetical protein
VPTDPIRNLGSLLPDEVPPGSEIQTSPVNSAAPAHAQTVRPLGADRPARQAGNPSPDAYRLAPGRGPSAPVQRAPPHVLNEVIGVRIDINILFDDFAADSD